MNKTILAILLASVSTAVLADNVSVGYGYNNGCGAYTTSYSHDYDDSGVYSKVGVTHYSGSSCVADAKNGVYIGGGLKGSVGSYTPSIDAGLMNLDSKHGEPTIDYAVNAGVSKEIGKGLDASVGLTNSRIGLKRETLPTVSLAFKF